MARGHSRRGYDDRALLMNGLSKTYGPEVNLFVDHSQIIQLAALRAGLWGTTDVWGRISTYKPPSTDHS